MGGGETSFHDALVEGGQRIAAAQGKLRSSFRESTARDIVAAQCRGLDRGGRIANEEKIVAQQQG